MRKDFMRRKSLTYKIKLWFYRITTQDVISGFKSVLCFSIEFIMCLLMFSLLFIIPAFFR